MAKKYWFTDKNIIISGASTGIGFCLAKNLACAGAHVMGIARNEEKLKLAKQKIDEAISQSKIKGGTFDFLSFDVSSSWTQLKEMIDERGFKVDVLINNAGIILPFNKYEKHGIDEARRVFEVNFFSHLKAYETFINEIKARKGAIINISSSSALCPVVGQAIYSASKSAVKSFTEAIMQEHKELYIALVCPGYTKTELFGTEQKSKMVEKIAMPAEKMGKKIFKKLVKKRKRIVIGMDAHLMSGFYRLAPKTSMRVITKVLKSSHDNIFEEVFSDD